MATAVVKPKAPKVPKEKKAAVVKKPRAHPPYADVCIHNNTHTHN